MEFVAIYVYGTNGNAVVDAVCEKPSHRVHKRSLGMRDVPVRPQCQV